MGQLQRGVVKWFNDAKGFGFIEHESGRDVFVHYSVITQEGFKTLKDGEEVYYELSEGDKGLHAAKVERAEINQVEEPQAADASDELAPNLQSGAVNTINKTNADMIEVERANEEARVSSLVIGESSQDLEDEQVEH